MENFDHPKHEFINGLKKPITVSCCNGVGLITQETLDRYNDERQAAAVLLEMTITALHTLKQRGAIK